MAVDSELLFPRFWPNSFLIPHSSFRIPSHLSVSFSGQLKTQNPELSTQNSELPSLPVPPIL